MNSDFVQLEAEALAKRVAAEPDNRARIRKIYSLTYGRLPSEEEIQIGLGYLHSEPVKEYEEDKNKPKDEAKQRQVGQGQAGSGVTTMRCTRRLRGEAGVPPADALADARSPVPMPRRRPTRSAEAPRKAKPLPRQPWAWA